ncbi:MAG: hypothetical protein CMP33_01060 [Rickettsiales bacterium]|nr:hypothetical protein [Rickettsiales bacterium]
MLKLFNLDDKKLIIAKILVIGVPSYAVAFFTGKILYVVPTIALTIMIANSIDTGNTSSRNRLEEESIKDVEADTDGLGDGEGGA